MVHGLLGVVVPIIEIRVIMPPRTIGVGVRIIQLIIVHKVGIFLSGSSSEDHLTISVGIPINSAYLTIESSVGNRDKYARVTSMESVMLKLSIFC